MYKFGQVTIVGRPNAGKSTLLNKLVGEKISIVSPKAQTTRDIINGVLTTENAQIVFVDTPGMLKSSNSPMTKYMNKGIKTAASEVDLILFVLDGERGFNEKDIADIKRFTEEKTPVIVVITKIDRAKQDRLFSNTMLLNEVEGIASVVPISVYRDKNLDVLMDEIVKILPEGEKMYDEEYLTDKPYRYLVAERIREKILYKYNEEIPHGISIEIAKFDYDEKKNMYEIYADIICEKQTHKGILIGKNGEALKEIATRAREDLERFMEAKVFLTIFVKVKENWRENESLVSQFGYNSKIYDKK